MPIRDSTLGYIDIMLSNSEEEHYSSSGALGSIIGLASSEDLQDHMVVEESIASVRREEDEVHHIV
jgi:hypothetical protein